MPRKKPDPTPAPTPPARHERIPGPPPAPPPVEPPPVPEELKANARAVAEWGRITRELAAEGRLETSDRSVVTLHCLTWATYAEAAAIVAKDGPVMTYNNGMNGPSPAYKITQQLGPQVRALLETMGMTAASRLRRKIGQLAEERPSAGDLPAYH